MWHFSILCVTSSLEAHEAAVPLARLLLVCSRPHHLNAVDLSVPTEQLEQLFLLSRKEVHENKKLSTHQLGQKVLSKEDL